MIILSGLDIELLLSFLIEAADLLVVYVLSTPGRCIYLDCWEP